MKRDWAREKVMRVTGGIYVPDMAKMLRAERARARRVVRDYLRSCCPHDTSRCIEDYEYYGHEKAVCDELLRRLK